MSLVPLDQVTNPPPSALTVEIPSSTSTCEDPSSSLDSSHSSSPTGILDSSTSCSSLPIQHLSIKFAPLPELAPRKRRSTVPLGMAARTQLTLRRRAHNGPDAYAPVANPMWTQEEMEEHKQRQLEQHRLRTLQVSEKTMKEGSGEVDDPFLVLGRLVKGASKQLWRKVSHKDREGKDKTRGEVGAKSPTEVPSGDDAGPKALNVAAQSRPVLTTISPNVEDNKENTPTKEDEEGRVWEEEIGDNFLNVGQTETFLEGREQYSKPKAEPIALSKVNSKPDS